MIVRVDCATCGQYFITQEALEDIPSGVPSPTKRAMLSAVTRERFEQESPITVCYGSCGPEGEEPVGATVSEILGTMVPQSDEERIDRALRNLHHKAPRLGQPVAVDPATDYPLLFAENPAGAQFMLDELVAAGLLQRVISYDQGGGDYTLTLAGRRRVDELHRTGGRREPSAGGAPNASSSRPSIDQQLLRALNKLDPQLGAAYSQTLADLNDESRLTTKDCANGIRELLREVVDLLTPDEVKGGQRRQKARAIFAARGAGTRITESAEEAAALIEQKADLFVKSYERANADSHTASSRRELEGLWRLADYLLRELLLD
jgi:hypothetical protein